MAHKRAEFFIDDDFGRLLDHVEEQADGPLELVLNGDTFDFDSVTQLPTKPTTPIGWCARLRGLSSEEWMSLFKIECIIADHGSWFERLGALLRRGGRVVFVLGNHDIELSWPSVQQRIRAAIGVGAVSGEHGLRPSEPPRSVEPNDEPVVFCPWFYLSGGDTYVSHGHQYDPNCVLRSAIDPLIKVAGRPRVRIPFGDLAGRYMLNGMGYFNPHDTGNYIRDARAYLRFFFRYMLRTQPLLIWTWFWGAMVTFMIALRDHLRAPMRDPLMVDAKVREVAWRSRATPSMVRKLHALNVPSACNHPLRLLRELWLDRGLLLIGVVYAAWQIVLLVNFAWPISPLWVLVPLALLLPPYFLYAATVKPTVFTEALLDEERAALIRRITGARRVVFGHTHVPKDARIGGVHYLNGGFWSPAFETPECKRRVGTQSFVWIRPTGASAREAALYEWPVKATEPRLLESAEARGDATPETPAAPRLDAAS